jgi:hypothetical protein
MAPEKLDRPLIIRLGVYQKDARSILFDPLLKLLD